jgi:hypothetical protein
VDAISATLGRWPSSADVSIPADLASDGIDELVRGFITRGRGKLRSDQPYTIAITAEDAPHSWTVRVEADALTTTSGVSGEADVRLSGTASQLYLGLWNRGDEMTIQGNDDVLDKWRDQVRISWR